MPKFYIQKPFPVFSLPVNFTVCMLQEIEFVFYISEKKKNRILLWSAILKATADIHILKYP